MKSNKDSNIQSNQVKGLSENKKIQSLKSSNQLNAGKKINSLVKNISHQASSSSTKLSYFTNINHSLESKSKSPKPKNLKYSMISKNFIGPKKIELNDKIYEKEKNLNTNNLRSYFQKPSRKSVDPSNFETKGNEPAFNGQFINMNPNPANLISNFYTYSKLSNRNNATINKYSTNISSLNNMGIEKMIEISKIHEKLTRKITEIKASDSSVDVLNSMSELYLISLSDLMSVIDNEIAIILKVIHCGLKTSYETYLKKIASVPEYINKINKLTKKCCDLHEQLKKSLDNIQENNKTIKILEEKLRNSDFELNRLKNELDIYKDNDKEKKLKVKQIHKSESNFEDIEELKKELHVHKKRENKLIYFYNLLEEKGYPVKQIYESQIKSITTERFTSNCDSEQSKNNDSLNKGGHHHKENKLDFTPLLNLSNISHKSSGDNDEDNIKFDFKTEEKHEEIKT